MFDYELTDEVVLQNAELLAKVFVAHRSAHWGTADEWEMRKITDIKEIEWRGTDKYFRLERMREICNEIESIKNDEAENLYDGMLNAETVRQWERAIELSHEHESAIKKLEKEFNEILNKE
jgi:hypothetical protein